MLELFKAINNLVWGPPLLLLLVGTGVYFTLRLGVFQIGKLPTAFRLIFSSDQSGQEMCPALRPFVQLWQRQLVQEILSELRQLLLQVVLGLFSGCGLRPFRNGNQVCGRLLAIKYRTKDANGQAAGGPMHYITLGMGQSGSLWQFSLLFQVF